MDALDVEFPALQARATASVTQTLDPSTTVDTWSGTATGDGADLDLESVFKASNVLMSEIRLSALVDKVLDVAMQAAGASRGYLVMSRGGALVVEAAEDADGHGIVTPGTTATEAGLPRSIMGYVARTGEALVLGDARSGGGFQDDAALAGEGPLSVLCAPIVHQGDRRGLVYLVNDLAADAFTPERARLVRLLVAQATIALENARLYEETETMARSFERFVPRGYLAPLGRRRIIDVRLGDAALREVTVLFSDLRGFTGLFETLSPEDGMALLNRYLGRMSPIIEANGGFVDKFVGDAIMALFTGAADRAVDAVVDMTRTLRAMNEEGLPGGLQLIAGSGLHAGPALIGTVGTADRLDVTATGDVVNSASRIEAATKTLGAPILVTRAVVDRMIDPAAFDLRSLGDVRLYGRAEPIGLVEVFATDEPALREAKRATIGEFEAALAAFRARDFDGAIRGFEACLAASEADTVAAALAHTAREAAAGHSLQKGDVQPV